MLDLWSGVVFKMGIERPRHREPPGPQCPGGFSIADLFRPIVPGMVTPVHKDRAPGIAAAMLRHREIRCLRDSSHRGSGPAIVALRAIGAETGGIAANAVAIAVLMLAELDVVDPNAAHEVENIAGDVDIGLPLGLREDKSRHFDRDGQGTFTRLAERNVIEPLHRAERRTVAEGRAHRAAPDLQGRLDRPGRDAANELGAGPRAGDRGWPSAGEAQKDGAVDLVALCHNGGRAQYCSGQGQRGCPNGGSKGRVHGGDSLSYLLSLRYTIIECNILPLLIVGLTRPIFASVSHHALEATVILTDLLCLREGPGALGIEAAEVVLHCGDVGLEVFPDQIGISAYIGRIGRQPWPFGRIA